METVIAASQASAVVMNVRDADMLITGGDGEAALLYIYLLRCGGRAELSDAAIALHRSDRDIEASAVRLRRMGLLEEASAAEPAAPASVPVPVQAQPRPESVPVPQPEPESESEPEPDENSLQAALRDPRFAELRDEISRALRRQLSSAEVRRLFDMRSRLELQPEVILLLTEYCREQNVAHGYSEQISLGNIEKTAAEWSARGIRSCEQAEEWLAELQRRDGESARLAQVMGRRDGLFTRLEENYLNAWYDMGFDADALMLADDRAVLRTGRHNMNYMDGILRSWHGSGLHSAAEIESGDPEFEKAPVPRSQQAAKPAAKQPAPPSAEQNSRALGQLSAIMKKKG